MVEAINKKAIIISPSTDEAMVSLAEDNEPLSNCRIHQPGPEVKTEGLRLEWASAATGSAIEKSILRSIYKFKKNAKRSRHKLAPG